MYYNNQFYIFGEKFESFYTSEAGLAWKKANKKFSFPYQDWSEADFKPSKEQPEFRGRETYSSVLDYLAEEVLVLRKKWKMRKMRKKVVKLLKHIPTLMNLKYGAVV